jgi:uncharacterized membrane protein YdbT with pleckstrin-like domain
MALIQCPECGHRISDKAKTCPSCGFDLPATAAANGAAAPLRELHPSWWNSFWLLVFGWLIVPLIIALVRRYSLVMRIYANRVSFERGLLTKQYRELFIKDIRSIDLDQSFFQRLLDVGDLTISSAATVDAAETVQGLPEPRQIRDLIISLREQATTD